MAAGCVSAYDFTKGRGEKGDSYCFGIDRGNIAASLRELADAVEKNMVAPQSVRVVTFAHHEDFTQTVLRFVFVEKKLKKLYGPEQFPLTTVRPE